MRRDLFLGSQTLPFCLEVQILREKAIWLGKICSCFPRSWVYLSCSVLLSTNTLYTVYGSLLFFNWGLWMPGGIWFCICFFLTVFRISTVSFAWIHPRPTWSCQMRTNVTLSWKRIQLLQHLKHKDSTALADEPSGRDKDKISASTLGFVPWLPQTGSGNRYSEHHTLTKTQRGSWNQHRSSFSTKRYLSGSRWLPLRHSGGKRVPQRKDFSIPCSHPCSNPCAERGRWFSTCP